MSKLYVNFDDDSDDQINNNDQNNKYDCEYDDKTNKFYKNLRETKMNALMYDTYNFNAESAFKFSYIWDPYTGIRKEKDPYGPLYFHPDDLIYFFYIHRLDLLWNEPSDETGGYYTGYYGDGVGSGENIYIPGREHHPEKYLFRLPIDDCYLPPDADLSIITMGPKLTNEEIIDIDRLANTYHSDNYRKCFGIKRPSLLHIKKLYDTAISETPDVSKYIKKQKKKYVDVMEEDEYKEYTTLANREAVDSLINI